MLLYLIPKQFLFSKLLIWRVFQLNQWQPEAQDALKIYYLVPLTIALNFSFVSVSLQIS